MNNKGFTLIELLVAVAVSSIVLLMLSFMLVQGTKMFSKENEDINVQYDCQIVRNQLDEALMEAKTLVIVDAGDDIIIYTGDVDESDNHLAAESTGNVTTERIITYDSSEGILYLSASYDYAVTEGSILCESVTDFAITLNEGCLREEEKEGGVKETYYVNPLSVNIEFTISGDNGDVESDMSVRIRNILKEVVTYRTDSRDTLLSDAASVESVKVK